MVLHGPKFDASVSLNAGLGGGVFDLQIFPRTTEAAQLAIKQWADATSSNSSPFKIVQRAADFDAARTAGQLAVVIACQDAAILGPSTYSVNDFNLNNLHDFFDSGLRVLQLSHNERNGLADGIRERVDAGLSLLGEAVVDSMNRLGMLIDVSHCSHASTMQAIRRSTKPVAVTHAGCRQVYPSKRNKSDEVIRSLADHGGYFGVYMMSRWLTARPSSSVDDVIDHIDHLVKVGGMDLPGFGSDQAIYGDPRPQAEKVREIQSYQIRNAGLPGAERLVGHVTCPDMDRPDRMLVLARALERRGYKPSDRDKILRGNFIRTFGAACG